MVDAIGKYIIPGLIDSHVHYNWYQGELFLHYGVTSVFDLGGGSWSHGMQKGVESGAIRAPRYYHRASFGDGANGKADKFAGMNTARSQAYANVNSPADAEAAVNAVVGKADIITLNEDWKGDVFSAISKAAHAKGLSIISHSYNALNTSDWGVDGIEHLTGVGMAATRSEAGKAAIAEMGICTHSYAPLLEQSLPCIAAGHKNSLLYRWMDPTYFDTMIAHLVKNHTYLNPTLDFEWGGIIDRSNQFELEDAKLLASPNLDYVPEDEKKEFLDQYHWADGVSAETKKEFTNRATTTCSCSSGSSWLRAASCTREPTRHRQTCRACRCITRCRYTWMPAFRRFRRCSHRRCGLPRWPAWTASSAPWCRGNTAMW